MARRKSLRPLEKDVQRQCIRYLKLIGYEEPKAFIPGQHIGVFIVYGTHRRRDDYQGTMQTSGAPDLFVEHVGFIELKRDAKANVTREQQLLADRGISRIVRSVDEFIALVKKALTTKGI